MRVLITGANGFLGKNLQLRLREFSDVQVVCFTRDQSEAQLLRLLEAGVDYVFHLAGVNRASHLKEFAAGNTDLTRVLYRSICLVAQSSGRTIPILFASSIQALLGNAYGQSKREAEEALSFDRQNPLVPVLVYRLPNVFGKWCRPNYNSVVATFCYNIARNLPIVINDPEVPLTLVYVDDVIDSFVEAMAGVKPVLDSDGFATVHPQYVKTVGDLAKQLQAFKDSRNSLITERVGTGLSRALYATYVSYLPLDSFAYVVPQHADSRGVFVEMLKTPDAGQFSYFTAHPGITRGGHYHHSKTEKFLVIKGEARFKFRHMKTGELHEVFSSGETPKIVETVPGWAHDITNVGTGELIVMLWANEVFDRSHPDTFACPL